MTRPSRVRFDDCAFVASMSSNADGKSKWRKAPCDTRVMYTIIPVPHNTGFPARLCVCTAMSLHGTGSSALQGLWISANAWRLA